MYRVVIDDTLSDSRKTHLEKVEQAAQMQAAELLAIPNKTSMPSRFGTMLLKVVMIGVRLVTSSFTRCI